MAAHANLAALDDLPPPAYCEQEREYDRKTATAIELSRQEQERQEEEEWEEWDEAKFEEAAKVRTSGEPTTASGSRPVSSSVRALPALPGVQTQPSNTPSRLTTPQRQQTPRADEKKSIKSKPAVPQSTKPRPSWYEEAGLGDSNSVSSASSSAGVSYSGSSSTSSSSANVRPTHHLMVHNFTSLDEQDDDDDSVLPPFAPIDPSLNTLGGIPVGDVITLSYNGRSNPNHFSRLGPPPGTPPPSSSYFSLSSSVSEPPLPASTPISSPPPPSRPVLQVEPIPRPRSTSTVRTTSTYNPGPPVRMGFDPSVAYAKNEILSKVAEKQQPSPASPVNPLSLYNSSVSAVLSPPSQNFNRPQAAAMGNRSPGPQNTHFTTYSPPPVSPRPMCAAATPPPNMNATQFPLHPTFSATSLSLHTDPYRYQSRWASSETQFAQFG